MGIIHTRASKQRDRAQRDLLRQQAARERADELKDAPLIMQPTIRALIAAALRRKHQRPAGDDEPGSQP
jgi:hypothetical protein